MRLTIAGSSPTHVAVGLGAARDCGRLRGRIWLEAPALAPSSVAGLALVPARVLAVGVPLPNHSFECRRRNGAYAEGKVGTKASCLDSKTEREAKEQS